MGCFETILSVDFKTLSGRVGSNIRKARWLKRLTQEQVSAAGMSYRYFQEVERGERNPSLQVLQEIASILDVTVADLTNIPGARPKGTPLDKLKAKAPPRGRHPRARRNPAR